MSAIAIYDYVKTKYEEFKAKLKEPDHVSGFEYYLAGYSQGDKDGANQSLTKILASANLPDLLLIDADYAEGTDHITGFYLSMPDGTRIGKTFSNCGIKDHQALENAILFSHAKRTIKSYRQILTLIKQEHGHGAEHFDTECPICVAIRTEGV